LVLRLIWYRAQKTFKIPKDHEIECRPIVAGNFAKKPVVKTLAHTVHGELNAEWIDANGLLVGNHQFEPIC
jgi:CDP-6-deoxy-D-xylo-4-hexulose-3-dehydrase